MNTIDLLTINTLDKAFLVLGLFSGKNRIGSCADAKKCQRRGGGAVPAQCS